jgi:hypothetical protein
MAGLASGTGNKRDLLTNRGNDLYQSPPVAVHALLGIENVPQRVWEPACGPGAIVKVLRESLRDVLATDLVDYRSPYQDHAGIDFLFPGIADGLNDGDRAIVTNPPFKNAHQFVARALQFSPYVAMLLRLAFLESEKRRDIIDKSCLARVHVFRKRLPMMHREGWEGRTANSGMAFAWFIWERGHIGPIELRRVSWEDFA